MNKKGLANGLIAFVLVLFIFSIAGLFAFKVWDGFTTQINSASNDTISQYDKDRINSLDSYIGWTPKLFVTLFIVLMIGYIITSATLPVSNEVYLLVFIGFLILITFVAMLLSNTWEFMIQQPNMIAELTNLKAIDYVMNYFPVITFLTGVIGAVIFYTRKATGMGGGSNLGGGVSGFE